MSIKHKYKYGMTSLVGIATGIALLLSTMTVERIPGQETHENVIEHNVNIIKADKNAIKSTIDAQGKLEIEFKPQKIEFVPVNVPMEEAQQREVFKICQEYGISYTLVIAIIENESQFDEAARSATGDTGLMQINDCNKEALRDLGFSDLTDPMQNVEAGAYLLSNLAEKYEVSEALMAYNMGEKNARKLWDQGIYESEYSREITAREAELSQYIDDLVMQGE